MKRLIPYILFAVAFYGCVNMMVDAWDKEMDMQEQTAREHVRDMRGGK